VPAFFQIVGDDLADEILRTGRFDSRWGFRHSGNYDSNLAARSVRLKPDPTKVHDGMRQKVSDS
jgi:hypothetical protein